MSIFNEFPYTNFHEMNLDWLLMKMKELVEEWFSYKSNWEKWKNDTNKAFNDLRNFVNNYFDNLDVQDEINNKLDQMVEDGTLEEVINDYLGNVKGVLENMTPAAVDRTDYKNMVRRNLVSFLVRNNFSSCINGSPVNNDYRVVYKYFIGKTYAGLFGAGSFVRNDVETINGQEYKVAYFDCTTFVSLITRGRAFDNSPYAQAFRYPDATDEDLIPYAIENPDPNMDYTFDCLNNLKTDNASRIMNNSGNTIQLLKHVPGGELDMNVFRKLETGDIIWMGSPEHRPNNYRNIYHCALYVETLEELNEYADIYGITFKPADSFSHEHGFIVEVVSLGSVAYQDKLVIHTLDYWLNTVVLGQTQNVFMTKSYANANNSNKQYSLVSGMYRMYDEMRIVNTCSYGEINFPEYVPKINIVPEGSYVGGRPMALRNVNIDDMTTAKYNGIWKVYNNDDLASLSGTLPVLPAVDSYFFDLVVMGNDVTGRGAIQILTVISRTQNVKNLMFIRQTGPADTTFGTWRAIGSTVQSGSKSAVSVPGNGYIDVDVTFPTEFNYTPSVNVTMVVAGTSTTFANTNIAIVSVSSTGFKARLFNNTSYNANIGFQWIAQ